MEDYVAEDDVLQAVGAGADARTEALAALGKRQKAWVLGKRTASGGGEWRPRKRHRKDAWHFVACLANQLQEGCGLALSHFQIPRDPTAQKPYTEWPLLSVSCDQGSVEESAMHFCQESLHLNWDAFPDPAHGCWNDVKAALRLSHQWQHVCCMLVVWNVPHGPWSEDRRFGEAQAVLRNFFKTTKRPQDSWLFMELLPRFIFDAQDSTVFAASEGDAADLIFERLRNSSAFSVKGCKVSSNRFMGAIMMGDDEAPHWTERFFVYLMTCLEQDYLHGTKFESLIARGKASVDRTTSSKKGSGTEADLLRACQNQMAVACMALSDVQNQYRQRSINIVCQGARRWHSEQSHQCRSVDGSFRPPGMPSVMYLSPAPLRRRPLGQFCGG